MLCNEEPFKIAPIWAVQAAVSVGSSAMPFWNRVPAFLLTPDKIDLSALRTVLRSACLACRLHTGTVLPRSGNGVFISPTLLCGSLA